MLASQVDENGRALSCDVFIAENEDGRGSYSVSLRAFGSKSRFWRL